MSEGFFSRWSRRKLQPGALADPEPPGSAQAPGRPGASTVTADANPEPVPATAQRPPAAQPLAPSAQRDPTQPELPLPTLEDVQNLTPDADFQPFVSRQVAPEVRNAAMRKLFSDPHFNVMDRMDIYIDDYGQPDPLPVGMLQKMRSAQFMQLVPPEAEEKPVPGQGGEDAHPDPVPNVAQSEPRDGETPSAETTPLIAESPRDNPHLRLQPDPAAEPQGLGPKPE